jgi:hypothetical protein
MTDTVICELIFRHPIKDTSDLFWRPFLTGKPDIYFRQHALPFSNHKDTVTRMKKKKKKKERTTYTVFPTMPVIGYPIIQLLWFLFVYTFDMGWKRAPQGKVLSIQSKFF